MKSLHYAVAIAILCLAGCKNLDDALLGGSHDSQAEIEQHIDAMAEEGNRAEP